MTKILQEHLYKQCLVYIDDILIFGRLPKENDGNCEIVIEVIEEYCLKIKKKSLKYSLLK